MNSLNRKDREGLLFCALDGGTLPNSNAIRRVRLELQRLRAFEFGNEEGVFVVIAGVTDVGQGEYTNDDIRLLTGLVAV